MSTNDDFDNRSKKIQGNGQQTVQTGTDKLNKQLHTGLNTEQINSSVGALHTAQQQHTKKYK